MEEEARSRKLSRLMQVHAMHGVGDDKGRGADGGRKPSLLLAPTSPDKRSGVSLRMRADKDEDGGEDDEDAALSKGMSAMGFGAARKKSNETADRLEQTLGLEHMHELQPAVRKRVEVRVHDAELTAAAAAAAPAARASQLRVAARRVGSEKLFVSRPGRGRAARHEWKSETFALELSSRSADFELQLLVGSRGDEVLATAVVSTAAWPPDRRFATEAAVKMVPAADGAADLKITLRVSIVSTPKIFFRARSELYSVKEVKLALLRRPVAGGGDEAALLAKRDSLFFRGERLDLLIGGGMTQRRDTLHASAGVLAQLEKRASLYDAAAPDEGVQSRYSAGRALASPKTRQSPPSGASAAALSSLETTTSPRLDWARRKQSIPPPPQTGYSFAAMPQLGESYQAAPGELFSGYMEGSPGAAGDYGGEASSSESSLPSPRLAEPPPSLNERYQRALEALDETETEGGGGFERRLERLSALVEAAKSFFATAQDYARVIISEAFFPEHLRTVKPTTSGGQLGGRKYVVRGILFKFALDDAAVFGRNDNPRAACSKVAGHEVKGLRVYQATRTRGLCFPLCCLVSYMGLQLVALSELPLGPDTLVYGSNDAGREVKTADLEVAGLIRQASAQLLVAPHRCGPDASQTIFSAVDLEGHRGHDGRIYLLDFSRALPPAEAGVGGEHLYRLFRPEFLLAFGVPLSADAFSRFQTDEAESVKLNNEAVKAAKYLTEVYIPTVVVPQLLAVARDFTGSDLAPLRLTPLLQRSGVNTRYLGLVLRELLRLHEAEHERGAAVQVDARARDLREKLVDMTVLECCARAIKIFLRGRLRDIAETPGALDESFYREICFVLNTLLCTDVASQAYFAETLFPVLRRSFFWQEDNAHLLDRLYTEEFSARWSGSCASFLILQRVRKMMGLKIAKATMEVLLTNKSLFRDMGFLDRFDIVLVKPVLKKSSIVEVSKGALFSLKAQLQVADISKLRYLQMSAKHWLMSQPSTAVYCTEYADVLLRQAQVAARVAASGDGGSVAVGLEQRLESMGRRVESYYGRALALEPRNPTLLFKMAQAYEFFGLHEAAELKYLQSLLLDTTSEVLEAFTLFLRERNDSVADLYRQRCDKLNENKLTRLRKSMARN